MNNMDEKQELLEIYKLHAELADSVSRQRGTANRFYMLILSGLAVLFFCLPTSQKRSTPRMAYGRFRTVWYAFSLSMVYRHPFLPSTEFR